jgi:Nif-specific regulatory protein
VSTQTKDNFSALYEVAQTIQGILEPRPLMEKVLEIALKHLDAERGFLLLTGQSGAQHEISASYNFGTESSPNAVAASSSVLKKVLEGGESVLSFDALADREFEASRSIVSQKIRSVICVPLKVRDTVAGALYLDSTKARGKFTDESLKFLSVFGHLAAIALDNARRYERLRQENQRLRQEVLPSALFSDLIGTSRPWRAVLDLVRRVVDTDVSVLITGESGTGKELIARAIHDNSPRSSRAFVALNCAAIPDQLLESELFGHRKGSFTGASGDKMGLVEVAHEGTLFLDEISDLPANLQTKLLRLLQEREIRRVGDTTNRTVDVRIISATNRDLQKELAAGRFRDDLFFRLNVVAIHLPPLRERREDIPLLADHFLRKASETHKRKVTEFSPGAVKALMNHNWPGNVRELQNVIERSVVLSRSTELAEADLELSTGGTDSFGGSLTLDEFERKIVEKTLSETDGNRTKTAEKLGVSLRWLQYRLKEWNRE